MNNLKQITTINIPALDGKRSIARAKDVFKSYIDSYFKNWNLDRHSEKTPSTTLSVSELIKDGTYRDIFQGNLKDLCLTQDQIIEFCKNNREQLSENYTMFLFELNGNFFVANVHLHSDGLLVGVYRFENDNVWCAEYRSRVVLKATDSLNLEHSDTQSLETLDPYAHIVEWLYLNDGHYESGKKWREEFLKELKKMS